MFKRLLLDETTAIVTFIAFAIAVTIFITFVWRALRMNRRQCERFERLPFETPTPAVGSPLAATVVDRSAQAPTLQKAADTSDR